MPLTFSLINHIVTVLPVRKAPINYRIRGLSPEFYRACSEGYLQQLEASKCLPLLCQDYSTRGGIWNRMPMWLNPALRHCSIFCSTEGKRDGILVIYSLQKPI